MTFAMTEIGLVDSFLINYYLRFLTVIVWLRSHFHEDVFDHDELEMLIELQLSWKSALHFVELLLWSNWSKSLLAEIDYKNHLLKTVPLPLTMVIL